MGKNFICTLSKEELENLYIKQGKNLSQMCEIVGCKSPITMAKILNQNGISTNINQRTAFKKRGGRTLKEFQFYLIREYYHEHRSMSSIANELNISNIIVKRYLDYFGFPVRTKSEQQTAEHSSGWNGGIHLKQSGYIEVFSPDHPNANKRKSVYQHQLVAEQKIGRYLKQGEVVHHIDFNKSNNDPDNLIVLSKSDHTTLHSLMKKGIPFDEAIKEVKIINE